MAFSNTDTETIAAEIAPQVRALQVIHGALVGGVAAYLGFVLSQGVRFSDDPGAMPLIPLAFAVVSAVMSFLLPPILRRTGLAALRGDSGIATVSLFGPFQTGHIVGIALLEGAGFLACFALTGGFGSVPRWFLAIPIGLIVLMVVRFPRRDSMAERMAFAREEVAL